MKQLKEILQLNWNEAEFGQSKLKADYKKQLYNIVAVDSLNNAWYNGQTVFIPDNRIMYITEQKGTTKKYISATFEKKSKGKGDNKKEYIHITYDHFFSPFANNNAMKHGLYNRYTGVLRSRGGGLSIYNNGVYLGSLPEKYYHTTETGELMIDILAVQCLVEVFGLPGSLFGEPEYVEYYE